MLSSERGRRWCTGPGRGRILIARGQAAGAAPGQIGPEEDERPGQGRDTMLQDPRNLGRSSKPDGTPFVPGIGFCPDPEIGASLGSEFFVLRH
jgi:hypothetical protein